MIAQHRRRKRFSPRADLFYGYDYNPAWPSILSVAHNEFDGGRDGELKKGNRRWTRMKRKDRPRMGTNGHE